MKDIEVLKNQLEHGKKRKRLTVNVSNVGELLINEIAKTNNISSSKAINLLLMSSSLIDPYLAKINDKKLIDLNSQNNKKYG